MDCEIEALIKFIEARPHGSMLRDIAITRLETAIRNGTIKTVEPQERKKQCQAIPLIHIKTGQVFRSSIHAAKETKINRHTILRDIYVGRHKYGFYPAENYSNQKA